MDAEDEVRKMWPTAYVDYVSPPHGSGEWLYQVRTHTGEILGIVSLTMDLAWQSAASRIQRDPIEREGKDAEDI